MTVDFFCFLLICATFVLAFVVSDGGGRMSLACVGMGIALRVDRVQ